MKTVFIERFIMNTSKKILNEGIFFTADDD